MSLVWVMYAPEMADFPGGSVEECGGDKQTGEAASIEPGGHAMPSIHRQEVQHGPSNQTGEDPESMCGTVGCMFIFSGLVSFTGRYSAVHKSSKFGLLKVHLVRALSVNSTRASVVSYGFPIPDIPPTHVQSHESDSRMELRKACS